MPQLTGFIALQIDVVAPADSLNFGGRIINQNTDSLLAILDAAWILPDPTAGTPLEVLRINAGGTDVEFAALGAGAHAADHILGGGDPLDADLLDIDHTPVSYSADLTAPHTDAQHLSAHIAGMDNRFTAIGDPATLLNGATPVLANHLNMNGKLLHGPGGEAVFDFSTSGASSVNYLRSRNSITAFPCVLEALGTDADIDIWSIPKGDGYSKVYRDQIWDAEELTGPVTLTAAHCGKTVYQDPTGALTLNLTAAATLGEGWHCRVVQTTDAFLCSVNAAGGDLLNGVTSATYLTGAWTAVHVVCISATQFVVVSEARSTIPSVDSWSSGTTIILNKREDGKVHIGTNGESFRPDAASNLGDGWHCWIKRDGVSSVDVIPWAAETFDGAASYVLSTDKECIHLVCDGTNFQIIGGYLE
jgi:hypothetical protein